MRPCCKKIDKYEQQSLGKFKKEFEGNQQTALASRSYICANDDGLKQISKGMSIKQNPLTLQDYKHTLDTSIPLNVENRSFRVYKHNMYSYTQKKRGLSNFYPKRIVLTDGINTKPLEL